MPAYDIENQHGWELKATSHLLDPQFGSPRPSWERGRCLESAGTEHPRGSTAAPAQPPGHEVLPEQPLRGPDPARPGRSRREERGSGGLAPASQAARGGGAAAPGGTRSPAVPRESRAASAAAAAEPGPVYPSRPPGNPGAGGTRRAVPVPPFVPPTTARGLWLTAPRAPHRLTCAAARRRPQEDERPAAAARTAARPGHATAPPHLFRAPGGGGTLRSSLAQGRSRRCPRLLRRPPRPRRPVLEVVCRGTVVPRAGRRDVPRERRHLFLPRYGFGDRKAWLRCGSHSWPKSGFAG